MRCYNQTVVMRAILIGVLALVSTGLSAQATLVGTSYQVGYIPAPPSVVPGALVNNGFLLMFSERKGFTLTAPLTVDISTPNIVYNSKSQITGTQIPSGTVINSYYVHGNVSSNKVIFSAQTISFSSEEQIIGIMVLASTIEHSNSVVGAPSTTYDTNLDGIGFHFPPAGTDDIGFVVATSSSPANTIKFNETVRSVSVTDFRIITKIVPTGTIVHSSNNSK